MKIKDAFLRNATIYAGLPFLPSDTFLRNVTAAELDHAGDIDYLGYISENKAFGIQIKPVTAQSNFGNYSVSERMKASFEAFTQDFGGKVFIVYSLDGEIANKEVIEEIKKEIEHLR
ncbi:MAG: hypothetical protein LBO74_08235 [Candidatus Symbiothrix sp.]|nr:hypothetical protein [Candidatus Symbiothrix sp.]